MSRTARTNARVTPAFAVCVFMTQLPCGRRRFSNKRPCSPALYFSGSVAILEARQARMRRYGEKVSAVKGPQILDQIAHRDDRDRTLLLVDHRNMAEALEDHEVESIGNTGVRRERNWITRHHFFQTCALQVH